MRREGPHDHSAAKNRDELPPLHATSRPTRRHADYQILQSSAGAIVASQRGCVVEVSFGLGRAETRGRVLPPRLDAQGFTERSGNSALSEAMAVAMRTVPRAEPR